MGLGVNFASQDKGLKGSLTDVTAGVSNLTQSIVDASMASAKMVFKPPNFGPALSLAGQLANDVKVTTTYFEAYGVQVNKVTNETMAGLNLTSAEFQKKQRQVSKTAFQMNIDVGTVTDSMVALTQAGVDVGKLGFKSFTEYQKFVTVTGADSKALAGTFAAMREQLGYTEEDIGTLLRQQSALGRKFDRGREAVAGFAGTMELVLQHAARFPETFGKEQVARFVKGTEITAGALMKLGAPAAEATQTAQKLGEQLMAGQGQMQSVFGGVSTELGDQASLFFEYFGSAEDAFKMLESSPDQFIETMGKTFSTLEKSGKVSSGQLDRIRVMMSNTYGTGVLRAVQNYDKLSSSLNEGRKEMGLVTDEFGNVAKRQKDGRTQAERFNLIQDRMITQWKKLHGVMSDQKFNAIYRKQTKQLTASLSNLAKNDGPVGKATQLFMNFRSHGIGGTLAAGSKFGFMLSEMGKQFGPILQVVPGVTSAMKALASPMMLVAGGLAAVYYGAQDLAKGEASLLKPILERMAKEAPQIIDKVKKVFTTIFSVVKKIAVSVWNMIDWNAVLSILKDALSYVMDLSVKFAFYMLGLTGRFVDYLRNDVDWGKVGNVLGEGLAYVAVLALGFFWQVIKKIPGLIVDVFKMAVPLALGILDGFVEGVSERFSYLRVPMEALGVLIKVLLIGAFAALAVSAGAAAIGVIAHFSTMVAQVIILAKMAAVAFYTAFPIAAVVAGIASIVALTVGAWGPAIADIAYGYEMSAAQLDSYGDINRRIAAGEKRMAAEREAAYKREQALIKGLSLAEFSNSTTEATNKLMGMEKQMIDMMGKKEGGNIADIRKVQKELRKTRAEFEETYGIKVDQSKANEKLSKRLLGIDERLVAAVKERSSVAARAMTEERSRLAALTNDRLNEALALHRSGTISKKVYEDRLRDIRAFAASSQEDLTLTAELVAGVVDVQSINMQKLVNHASAVSASYVHSFREDSGLFALEMAGLSDTQKSELEKQQNQLTKAMQADLEAVFSNAKLGKAEMIAAADDIVAEYNKLSQGFGDMTKLAVEEAAKGNQEAVTNQLASVEQLVSVATNKIRSAASEQSGILMKEMGVTGAEAADMIGTIANIKPKKFKKNIKIVNEAFTKFLKDMDETAKNLINATTESLNMFWETSEKGWTDQTGLIQKWSGDAGRHIQSYWTDAIMEAGKGAFGFSGLMNKVVDHLSSVSERFNIMDILASPSEIKEWADAVVVALANAFRSGVHADAMVSAAYRRAMSAAQSLQAQAGPATPTAVPPAGIASGDTEGMQATMHLLRSLDNPAWTTGPIYDLLQRQTVALEEIQKGTKSGGGNMTRDRKPGARRSL